MLLKNGKKYAMIQEGNEVQLQIHDLTSQDSGIYRCCAGNLETRANIIVKGRFDGITCHNSYGLYLNVSVSVSVSVDIEYLIVCTVMFYLYNIANIKTHQIYLSNVFT